MKMWSIDTLPLQLLNLYIAYITRPQIYYRAYLRTYWYSLLYNKVGGDVKQYLYL